MNCWRYLGGNSFFVLCYGSHLRRHVLTIPFPPLRSSDLTGKPRGLASHLDIPRGAENFLVFADIIAALPTESFDFDTPDGGKAINHAVRRPLGIEIGRAHV